jgi:long-chain acyl-CoA synthetase
MDPKRCFDFLFYQLEKYPLKDAMACKVDGKWLSYSTEDIIKNINEISHGLLNRGIKKGDRIAIISENRPEWLMVDLAIQQIGAVSVPLYPNAVWIDYQYAFDHAGVKMVFFSTDDIGKKVQKALGEKIEIHSFSFDELPSFLYWKKVFTKGDDSILETRRSEVKPEDLFTIIYTSGTTGKPKGVMLNHNNVVTNAISVGKRVNLIKGNARILSFLPLCHIFERTASFFYMYHGLSIYYAESLDVIGDNLREVKPDFFVTVPRLLEKVYEKIEAKGNELSGIKKSLFFWALGLALKYDPNRDMGFWFNFQHRIADKLIFSKWRDAIGGNVKYIGSGAAALQPKLARVFWAAGIKVLEAYGLTESSPGITVSLDTHEDIRIGCVGPAIEGVEVKIADDGEVLCKGPNVMMGYYKDPEQTAEVIKDGWLHTGDIGQLVEGKFLKITDRKKEIFKTSGGKYIAPQPIENMLKESVLVDNAMIIGENEKYPSALIVPNFEELEKWSHRHGISSSDINDLLGHEHVLQKFRIEIEKVNNNLGQWESIKEFRLLPELWSIDGGELTPTLKLKRRIIMDKHQKVIDEIYS